MLRTSTSPNPTSNSHTRVGSHSTGILYISAALAAPILGDPSRSAADPYAPQSDLKREEPVLRGRGVEPGATHHSATSHSSNSIDVTGLPERDMRMTLNWAHVRSVSIVQNLVIACLEIRDFAS